MSDSDLKRQIDALTTRLAAAGAVDRATRESLTGLRQQIARLAELPESSVTDRLEELAVRFEADHPAAGVALRQAIDALAKAGM